MTYFSHQLNFYSCASSNPLQWCILRSRDFSFHLMPVAPPLYLHRLLNLLLHLLPHYDSNYFLHSWSFPCNLSRLYSFPSLPLIHLPPSTSSLSVINPFTNLNIPLVQFCKSVNASSAFSLIGFETAFLALFFMLSYLLLFPSVLFCHIASFVSFFLETASFTSSFHHQASPVLLLIHLMTCP